MPDFVYTWWFLYLAIACVVLFGLGIVALLAAILWAVLRKQQERREGTNDEQQGERA